MTASDNLPVARWPSKDDLSSAAYIANQVAATEFVPKGLRGKAPAVLAAVLAGRELGIGPMEALQKMHVIDGRVAVSPELMRTLVLRAGHSIRVETYTDECVALVGKRADTGEQAAVAWTIEDARRAGLANKDNWKHYPRAMLLARATAELCRLLFPDAISGLSYVPEELGDDQAPDEAPEVVLEAQAVVEAPPARDDTHGGSAGNAPPSTRTRDTPRAAGAASPRGAQPPALAVTPTATVTGLDGEPVDVDLATGEVVDVPAAVETAAAQPEQASWDDLPPAKPEPELTSAALAVIAKAADLKWQTMVGIARGKAAAAGVPAEQLPDLGPDSGDIVRLDDFPAFLPFLRDVIERQSE